MKQHVKRALYGVTGMVALTLGVIGVFLPVLPTVPFMLIALWAFSNSSQRLHDWLYHHPRLGHAVRQWKKHRAIAARTKLMSASVMSLSAIWLVFFSTVSGWPLAAALAFMAYGAWFVLSRPTLK